MRGIDIDLSSVQLQSLTIDNSTITTTNANAVTIDLVNVGPLGGTALTVHNSTIDIQNPTAAIITGAGLQIGLNRTSARSSTQTSRP